MPPELRDAAPPTGAVCALVLTERQYSSITYLVGGPSYQELAVGEWGNISL
jgi:CRISPR/Cas system-associated protein endoribonuclease Cas2